MRKSSFYLPFCGGADESKLSSLINTPLWVFHGEKDEAVPVDFSRKIVAAIRKKSTTGDLLTFSRPIR